MDRDGHRVRDHEVGRPDRIALHPPGAGSRVRVLRRLQRRLEHIHRQPARPGRERRGPTLCRRREDGQRASADGTGASPTLRKNGQRFSRPWQQKETTSRRDRKRVGEGKGGSERVEQGGRGVNKKNKKSNKSGKI